MTIWILSIEIKNLQGIEQNEYCAILYSAKNGYSITIFTKESEKRTVEYKDMLKRYDIYCAKTWHKNINGNDYIFVYHEVGPDFREKMKGWDTSNV